MNRQVNYQDMRDGGPDWFAIAAIGFLVGFGVATYLAL